MTGLFVRCPTCMGEGGHRHLTGAWITCPTCGAKGKVLLTPETCPGHELVYREGQQTAGIIVQLPAICRWCGMLASEVQP